MTREPQQKPADPRAGKLCSNCNTPRPAHPRPHCATGQCTWWRCDRCKAVNDMQGRNDIIDLAGNRKTRAF